MKITSIFTISVFLLCCLSCSTVYFNDNFKDKDGGYKYKGNDTEVTHSREIGKYDFYVLSICEQVVSQLEGNSPELIPYPYYANCDAIRALLGCDTAPENCDNVKIVDRAYIMISRGSGTENCNKINGQEDFIYLTTRAKNENFFASNVMNIANINEVYLGTYVDSGKSVFGNEQGSVYFRSKGHTVSGRRDLFRWDLEFGKDENGSFVKLKKLPLIEERNTYNTFIPTDSVFATPLKFYKKNLAVVANDAQGGNTFLVPKPPFKSPDVSDVTYQEKLRKYIQELKGFLIYDNRDYETGDTPDSDQFEFVENGNIYDKMIFLARKGDIEHDNGLRSSGRSIPVDELRVNTWRALAFGYKDTTKLNITLIKPSKTKFINANIIEIDRIDNITPSNILEIRDDRIRFRSQQANRSSSQ